MTQNNVQPSYAAHIGKPRPGTIAGTNSDIGTGICETVAGIGFGLAVTQGAGDNGVVLGGATKFIGISVKDITLGAGFDAYPQYASLGVNKKGFTWVAPAVAVVCGDPVTYVSATGRLSNTGGVAIPGARWADSSDADGAARVELMANAGS